MSALFCYGVGRVQTTISCETKLPAKHTNI